MSHKINNIEGFPILQTERLSLIALCYEQADELFTVRRDPEHHNFTDSIPDSSIEETKAYIEKMIKGVEEGKWLIWGIQNKQTAHLIGTVSLWNFNLERTTGELGFGLLKNEQHQGYMREALKAVITYGFKTLKLKEIQAYTEEKNIRARQLLEKMDFIYSDNISENGYLVGKTFNMCVYILKKQD